MTSEIRNTNMYYGEQAGRKEGGNKSPEEQKHDLEKSYSMFYGFLEKARENEIRISTTEWLHFLQLVQSKLKPEEVYTLSENRQLFEMLRVLARITLVKNKGDEGVFNNIFDEYFLNIRRVITQDILDQETEANKKEVVDEKKDNTQEEQEKDEEESEKPVKKESLGIQEVDENLNQPDDGGDHGDNEQIHGGKKDQHNDILQQQDENKEGGGEQQKENEETDETDQQQSQDFKKVNDEVTEQDDFNTRGVLVGGGKGRFKEVERVEKTTEEVGQGLDEEGIEERRRDMEQLDRYSKYERRPGRADIRQIVKNLRRIIEDTSQVRSREVDIKKTVKRFARKDFRIDYIREREKQPEIVLFIDVGGPVDEWSPLIREVSEEMTKGLTKLEVYLFHNNLYGYVWKPEKKDFLESSFARPDSLISIKSIVKRKKKVIIYGDADMSYDEVEEDMWAPKGNDERVEKFGMDGIDCLNWIKNRAHSTVWINPIFSKDWEEEEQYSEDGTNSIKWIGGIISMYDLSVGGVEDAITELMKKK